MRVRLENVIKKTVQKSVAKNNHLIPKKTGNLRYRATKVRGTVRGNNLRIVIDQRIAPYATYVNERPSSTGSQRLLGAFL